MHAHGRNQSSSHRRAAARPYLSGGRWPRLTRATRAFSLFLLALTLTLHAPALAQDERAETVRFEPGATSTTIRDTIRGDEYVLYRLGAETGQTLRIALDPSNLATYFNLYEPGRGPGDEALATGGLTGPLVPDLNRFEGDLPTSGEYTISVYMMRSAARRGERSDFTLDIAIDGEIGAVVQNDFADGLQGGPDWWSVNTEGSTLNLRAGASAGAELRGRLDDGAVVQNLGCRMAEGRRWCEVAAPGTELAGWVAGDFLAEAAPPEDADAPAPETRTETVAFAPGESGATRSGTLPGGGAIAYVFDAAVGQVLTATLTGADPSLYFNVFAPGGHLLYDTVGGARRDYRGQIYAAGDHTVQVYHLGDAAAAFEIEFGIE